MQQASAEIQGRFTKLLGAAVAIGILVFFALSIGNNQLNRMSADDWTIAMMLSNDYPGDTPCLFINAFLSNLVHALNGVLQHVNWFLIIERASIALAASTLSYILITKYGSTWWSLLCITSFFVLIVPGSILDGNFTFIATALPLCSGIVLYVLWDQRQLDLKHMPMVLAVALLFVSGFLFRPEAWLLALPFLAIIIAHRFITCQIEQQGDRRQNATFAIILLALFGICALLYVYDLFIWGGDDQLNTWREYNKYRSHLSDWPTPDYSSVAKQLETIGVTQNDWWLVTHWTTADPSFFTVDKMRQISEIQQQSQSSTGLENAVISYVKHIASTPLLFLPICITLACVLFKMPSKQMRLCILTILLSFLINLYFFNQGRLPERVEYPVWACSLVLCFMLMSRENACIASNGLSPEKDKRKSVHAKIPAFLLISSLSAMIVAASLGLSFASYSEALGSGSDGTENIVLEYSSTSPNSILWWDASTMASYQLAFDSVAIPSSYCLEHNFKLGGWTTFSPQTEWSKKNAKVQEGIESLYTNSNTLYVTTPDDNILDHLTIFLSEHAGINAHPLLETTLNDERGTEYQLWKFTSE